MDNLFYVMAVGTTVSPMQAAIRYGKGENLEKEPDCGYLLLEDVESGKRRILSGSGNPENYKDCIKVMPDGSRQIELVNQGRSKFTAKPFKIIDTCYGTDQLPKFGKGSYPFYVMK